MESTSNTSRDVELGLLPSTTSKRTNPLRDFGKFDVVARLRSDIINPETAELMSSLPDTGFGTVSIPSGYADQVYPSCGLFLLGFFCIVPWVFGAMYCKATNTTARTAGILSLISSHTSAFPFMIMIQILAVTTALVVGIVLLTNARK